MAWDTRRVPGHSCQLINAGRAPAAGTVPVPGCRVRGPVAANPGRQEEPAPRRALVRQVRLDRKRLLANTAEAARRQPQRHRCPSLFLTRQSLKAANPTPLGDTVCSATSLVFLSIIVHVWSAIRVTGTWGDAPLSRLPLQWWRRRGS